MYVFITIVIIAVCVALGFVVLIQNPKGGGLSSTFGSVGNQILGARRSTDVVEKATWTLAVLLLAFSLLSVVFIDRKASTASGTTLPKSETEQSVLNKPINTATPPAGAASPAQNTPAQTPPPAN